MRAVEVDPIQEIKNRLDLAEIVEQTTELVAKGGSGRLWGLCPFHSERTPSFTVNNDMGIYYCFGCKAKGDIFAFIMETQGVGFRFALEQLAEQAGVTLPEYSGHKSDLPLARQVILKAQQIYQQDLASPHAENARQELRRRQIGRETSARWRLGYVHPGHLISQLNQAELEMAKRLGLVRTHAQYGDREALARRLILPISDVAGRPVAFSGRVLDNSNPQAPKYLNTTTSFLWNRSRVLYGLDLAVPNIRQTRTAIIVEGQMDCIAMHRIGYANTVAPCGSGVSREHVASLATMADRIVVLGDGDQAGRGMAMDIWNKAVGFSLAVLVATLPAGMDPDEMSRNDPQALADILAAAISPVNAILDGVRFSAKQLRDDPEAQARVIREGADFIQELQDPLVRSRLAQMWTAEYGVAINLSAKRIDAADIPYEWTLDRGALAAAAQSPEWAADLRAYLLLDPYCRTAMATLQQYGDPSRALQALQMAPEYQEGFSEPSVDLREGTGDPAYDALVAACCAQDEPVDLDDLRWQLVRRYTKERIAGAVQEGDSGTAGTLARLLAQGPAAETVLIDTLDSIF